MGNVSEQSSKQSVRRHALRARSCSTRRSVVVTSILRPCRTPFVATAETLALVACDYTQLQVVMNPAASHCGVTNRIVASL
jgi:hypothetical protein